MANPIIAGSDLIQTARLAEPPQDSSETRER